VEFEIKACRPIDSVTIVILAGGMSSRFGSNKALERWQENTVIEGIIQKERMACPDLALSVRQPDEFVQIDIPKISDVIKDKGPLGGLYSALAGCKTKWVMLIACDMPLIETRLIKYMLSIPARTQIIIPWMNGRFEPLHAVYNRSLLPLVKVLIQRGRLSMLGLLEIVPFYTVKEREVFNNCKSPRCLENFNTRSEFERLMEGVKQAYE